MHLYITNRLNGVSMQKYIALICTIILAVSAYGFDRNEQHQNRFEHFDLSNRNILEKSASNVQLLSADFSDLAVSLSVAPAKFSQDNSSVVHLDNGSWIVLFDDNRNGSKKIYWQKYDSLGLTVEANQLVASSPIGSDLVEPVVRTDSLGRIYLFFRNSSEGLIYGNRYNPDLTIDIPSFLINDTSDASFAGPFDATVYPSGKIAVAWENYSIVGSTIECRLYNEFGISTFGPATVNSDGGAVSHWIPSIDSDPAGNFVVAWEDYRNSRADIYARLFNGGGTAVGSEFAIVPPPYNASNQFAPKVCYTSDNLFVIGWIDQREIQEPYYQVYSALSGLVGSNRLISTPDSLFINWNLSLAKDTANLLSAVWASFGPQNYINMQSFTNTIDPLGNKIVMNSSATGRRWQPSLNFNASNKYMLSWSEFVVDNSDIHINIFNDSHNSILSDELKVNDDSIGAVSVNPQMVVSTDWYNLIVFEDRRNDAGDIYIQTVSNAGIRLYSNIKVNQDNGAVLQTEPSIAASIDLKKSLVTWVDNRDINAVSGQRIFARFGSEFGLFSENEFLVSDSLQTALKKSPKAAINSSGKALIVWLDKRSGTDQIYGQWIASDGSLDGTDFMISDSLSDSTITDLQVAVDNSANYYVTYVEKQQTPRLIKSIQFLGDGSLGTSFTKEFPVEGIILEQSAVAVKSNGNIVVIFGVNDTYKRLYLAEYSSAGVELTAPFEILDMANIDAVDPSVSVSNNDYISVTWVDTRNGKKEIYTQLFDNLMAPINGNNKVSVDSPEFMQTPVTTAHNGRVWYCWTDPRANGLNIYTNNSIYLATDIDDQQQNIPTGFELIQNYPNPFNPSTEIAFRLPEKSYVTISVYNMLGQHVKTLVESDLSAGVHTTTWDATNKYNSRVASGIYFYKMETEKFVEMKKMMLLK